MYYIGTNYLFKGVIGVFNGTIGLLLDRCNDQGSLIIAGVRVLKDGGKAI